MVNLTIEIKEINKYKIIFKSNYSWAFCLNAQQENKINYYFLENNILNQQKIKKILPSLKFNFVYKNENTKIKLRNYQIEDVNFLSKLNQGAIFSEMRTGKTPIALFIFKKWNIENLIIIVPVILQSYWQKSVENWLNLPAYIITYLDKNIRLFFYQKLIKEKQFIIIISKETFRLDSIFFKNIKEKNFCVIIDEAHYLRNYNSQQSKSIYILKNASHKLILTGTPIVNHYSDIFGILKFLQPEIFSSYWEFSNKYFNFQEIKFTNNNKNYKFHKIQDFKTEKHKQLLQQKIKTISVNRKQKEVLPWLPKIIYQQEYLLMEEEQQKIYLELSNKWKEYKPLEIITKLKSITLYPKLFGVDCLGIKINFLINYLKEKNIQKTIIFSTRSETFLYPLSEILEKEKIKVGLITGKTSAFNKEEIINLFQNKNLNILLCNIKSANLGINLSKANTIIFADRSYSPADNKQAEARFLPTNDQENKEIRLIIDLICYSSIDEKINELLKKKEDIIKVINNKPNYFFE